MTTGIHPTESMNRRSRLMIRIVTRFLCGLSVFLALAAVFGTRLEAAPNCPFASSAQTGMSHHGMHTMSPDTPAKAALTHHGHPAVPEPCKHGCNAVAFVVPPFVESPAPEIWVAAIPSDRPAPCSRPTPPTERPPKIRDLIPTLQVHQAP